MTLRVLLLLLFAAAPVAAQPALTVGEALAHVDRHPDLAALRESIRRVEGQRLGANPFEAPTLFYAREGIAGTDYAEQRLALGGALASPFATRYRRHSLSAEADALAHDLRARQAALWAGVKTAFVDLMYAERLVALRTEQRRLADALVEAARLREELGEGAGLETMRAELEQAEARAALADAERLRAQSETAVRAAAALGEEEAPVPVVTPGPLTYAPVALTEADVLGRVAVLPEVRSAATRVNAAEWGVRQAGSLFPDLAAEAFVQDFGDGFNRFGFQVGLRLPIPSLPQVQGERAVARAERERRAWEAEALTRALAAEAEAAWQGYRSAAAAVEAYRAATRPQADSLVALTREGYLVGEVPLYVLIDAQRTALAAEERYALALRDYHHWLVALERFAGRALVFTTEGKETPALSLSSH